MKHLLRYILVLKKLLKFFHKLFDKHDHHRELYTGIKWYINFYNNDRGHSSLDYETPAKVYFGT